MQKGLIFKYTDNYFYFYNIKKEELIKEKISKIIEKGKIIDIEKFITTLDKFIKKHKLNTYILKNTLYILIPSYSNNTDIFLLTYAFKTLNYYKYKFVKEVETYNHLIKESTYILDIWSQEGELSYLENNHIISIPFTQVPDLKNHKLIVINNTEDEFKIKSNSKNIYYLENTKTPIITFLVKKLTKDPLD